MTRKANSPPESPSQAGRSEDQAASTAAITIAMVNDGGGRGELARRKGRPLAFASQAAPCAGRGWWHVMYQCGACGGTHFGRSREELMTGPRLARCGRRVWLIIARVYRNTDSGAAA